MCIARVLSVHIVEWGVIPILEQDVIGIVEWGVIPIVELGVIPIVEWGFICIVEQGVINGLHMHSLISYFFPTFKYTKKKTTHHKHVHSMGPIGTHSGMGCHTHTRTGRHRHSGMGLHMHSLTCYFSNL